MYVFIIHHGRGWLTYKHANTTTSLLLELVRVIIRHVSKLSCMKQYLKFCPLNFCSIYTVFVRKLYKYMLSVEHMLGMLLT